ncbi:MAG: NYN domain-containing protein [Candidatus Eisenbacteria bacterium]|nr:NYN domain-containing protein [Candidatus Eisenbacteria bacterium]
MAETQEPTLALFIDFDNVALGARESGVQFEIHSLLQRLLEKGKILIKKAYADWSHYKEFMASLHEAGIELIEIPWPKVSGKNSADIRLVVDAMEICYAKQHLDTFVIVSGDSDFTPLVSKLRENNKAVIGIGMRDSSSRLLIANCDEFIFYDDLVSAPEAAKESLTDVPDDKRKLFRFLLTTVQGLMQDGRDALYSSLIKDTMKRKRPDFRESNYGYANFGDLLEDAMAHDLIVVERDAGAGGTWVVKGLGKCGAGGARAAARRKASRRRRTKSAPAAGNGDDAQVRASSAGRRTTKKKSAPRRRRTSTRRKTGG